MRVGDIVKIIDCINNYNLEGVVTRILDNGLIAVKWDDETVHYYWPENLKVIEEVEN